MSLSTIPLLGYAPDLDPTQPGVFSYTKGMEATPRGWMLQRSLLAASAATGGNPGDGFIHYSSGGAGLVGAPIVVQGSTIFISIGGTSMGTVAATDICSFCQYGTLALLGRFDPSTGNPRTVQSSVVAAAFADLSATGIPKAAICVNWGPPTSPRIMLLNIDDGTVLRDGWATSHQGGPTLSWVPDIATGAAAGRLLGAGIIRCGIAYNDDIIAFSDKQMWKGVFIGPPYTVQWQKISSEVGCVGPYAARVVNGILYFLSAQGLFMYDGTYPRKMELPIQQELGTTLYGFAGSFVRSTVGGDGTGKKLIVCVRDGGGTSATPVRTYIIDLLSNKIGLDGRGTWLFLDDQWVVSPSGGIQQVTSSSQANNGLPYAASLSDLFGIGLHKIGANKGDTKILGVYPRFLVAPSTYSWNDYFGPTMSEALGSNTGATTISATPWRADFLKSARWHAPRLLFSSNGTVDMEIADVMLNSEPAGNQ